MLAVGKGNEVNASERYSHAFLNSEKKKKKQAAWYSGHQEEKLEEENLGFAPGEIVWWGEVGDFSIVVFYTQGRVK